MCLVCCVLFSFVCFGNDALCAVVWCVWCDVFMLVCDCLVWLCGVFVNVCVMLYVVCVGVCGLSCACGLCGLLSGLVWCVFCARFFVCAGVGALRV